MMDESAVVCRELEAALSTADISREQAQEQALRLCNKLGGIAARAPSAMRVR
jgi:hypothetical protein